MVTYVNHALLTTLYRAQTLMQTSWQQPQRLLMPVPQRGWCSWCCSMDGFSRSSVEGWTCCQRRRSLWAPWPMRLQSLSARWCVVGVHDDHGDAMVCTYTRPSWQGNQTTARGGVFATLNGAVASTALCIVVSDNVDVQPLIHVLHITSSGSEEARRGAGCTVMQTVQHLVTPPTQPRHRGCTLLLVAMPMCLWLRSLSR